jgi:uncharacterized membrane protein
MSERESSSKGLTWALAITLGLVIASLQESFAGFVIGAVLGALLAQVLHLRGRVRSLSDQVLALKRSRDAAPDSASAREHGVSEAVATPPANLPATDPLPSPQADVDFATPASSTPAEFRAVEPAPTQSPEPTFAHRQPAAPSAIEVLFRRFVEWLKAGNPLARVGIVILFLGGAFLAKYAADHSLFPIELRFVAIALGAFALLFVGWRLRERRPIYGQLLQGGGIAGLYLTVFAAASFAKLLPLGFAFALMVIIALSAAVLAVAQNAISLAVIGTTGGFLAPLLVSTGSGNHVALFSYHAVLNLGVFTVAWFRTWRVLNVLGFVFTFSVTGLWRATGYEPHELVSADAFLILFFLMYVAVSILNCVRQPPKLTGYVSGTLVFGLPIVAFALHASLLWRVEYALAWSALALGSFYLMLAWILFRTRVETFHLLVEAFAALGVIFASLAIPLAFDTRTTAAMWAVEGAGLIWLGLRQQRKLPRIFGALLQFGGATAYLIGLHRPTSEQAIINSAYIGALMLALSALFTAYWMHRERQQLARYESSAEAVFTLWGVLWWLFAGLHEIDRFVQTAFFGCELAYVAVTALLLEIIGARARWVWPQRAAVFLPAVAAVLGLIGSLTSHPFMYWGAMGWLVLWGTHYWLLHLSDAQRRSWPGLQWLHAGAYWVIALVLAWDLNWQVARQTAGVWLTLSWGVVPALMLALIGARLPRPRWPLAEHIQTYRMLGAVPLAVALCVWIVAASLTETGDPVWLPYVPVLNPLDITVALSLTSLALWWTSLDRPQRSQLWQVDVRILIACVAGIVFLWLNSALIRALHYGFDAPITLHGMARSTLIQSALSIFWGLLGFIAMTTAARQRWRYVWIVGAGLMVVVIAKLFLVDLSSSGTLERIASFLTVGALLLITGYLAPLPPKNSQSEEALG